MQVDEVRVEAEMKGSEQVLRKCLALVDQNTMPIDRGEISGSKGKSGATWKRLQRAQPEEKGHSTGNNKENVVMKSLKRGTRNGVEIQQEEIIGNEKRMKTQADQNELYNVQVEVASLEWSKIIQ